MDENSIESLAPERDAINRVDAELTHDGACWKVALELTEVWLVEAALPSLNADLHRRVAVLLWGADLRHRVRLDGDHGYRHRSAVRCEDLGHPNLSAEQSKRHFTHLHLNFDVHACSQS